MSRKQKPTEIDRLERKIGSPIVIPVFFIFIIMFVVSIIANIEDYNTSRHGYSMLPTRKSSEEVIWAIALVPQIGQIGFAWVWGRERRMNTRLAITAGIIALFLHVADVGTDTYFKASGSNDLKVWLIALFESEAFFTFGSEFMLTVSVSELVRLAPEVYNQLKLALIKTRILDKDEDDLFDDLDF